jgi:hypothetical protein
MEKVWYAYLVTIVIFDRKCYGSFKAFGIDGEMKKTSLLRHAWKYLQFL